MQATATPPEKVKYTMPVPGIGQGVLWYDSRGVEESAPAIVVGIGNDSVDLLVYANGAATLLPKGAVRHVSDPDRAKIDNAQVGVWDFSPEWRLHAEALAEINKALDTLLANDGTRARMLSEWAGRVFDMGKRLDAFEKALKKKGVSAEDPKADEPK